MKPLRPFHIVVYNRVTQAQVGEYVANQVPQRGDMISMYPQYPDAGFFRRQVVWSVDAVVWSVAAGNSMTARELAGDSSSLPNMAHCADVEVHAWPAQGPFWPETPPWAAALLPGEDGDDDG